jgi:hypothetical protein
MTTIVSHGTWATYVPDPWPLGLPNNIAFCQSDTDGTDWYQFQTSGVSQESVKMVCMKDTANQWRVVIATVDASRLFPENKLLIEVYDGDLNDPQATYGQMVYDEVANTLAVAPPPVIVPTTASKLGLKRALTETSQWLTVKAWLAADEDRQDDWDLAVSLSRTDPLIQGMIALLSLTSAQADSIFVRAKALA